MNLTDNEIIKALECCGVNCDCAGCPKEKEPYGCYFELCGGAFDLINRQKTEIYDLKSTLSEVAISYDAMRSAANSYKMHYEKAQAEIERLKDFQKDGFFNLLGNCLVYSKNLKDYNDMRKGLKAEAIKEFAKRVQKIITIKGRQKDYFDNLVKEMVGE